MEYFNIIFIRGLENVSLTYKLCDLILLDWEFMDRVAQSV